MSENQELNKIYKELDEKTKKEIDQLQKQEFKEDVLKTLGDPVIIELYKTLKPSVKQKIDSYKIRDRVAILKQLTMKKEVTTKVVEPLIKVSVEPLEQEESIDEIEEPVKENVKNNSTNDRERKAFEKMVQLFYQSDPFIASSLKNAELEVRFGTKGIKYLTKNDYDDVIKKLKSLNFVSNDSNGEYRLSIQNEFLDQNTGKFIMDRNTRTEIYGLAAIQSYCKTNNIQELIKSIPNSVKFTKKELVFDQNKNKVFPVNFPDFNFRVSYQIENKSPKSRNFIIQNWPKTKKTFRYMNRVSFQHADFPITVDLSIVKNDV